VTITAGILRRRRVAEAESVDMWKQIFAWFDESLRERSKP
jgi:hypothetical protein